MPQKGRRGIVTMTTQEELVRPLLDESSHNYMRLRNAKKNRKLPWDKLMAVCFSLLLCWQLVGTCLYFIRCLECFKEKTSTFLCDRNAAFPYSEDFELAWLVTQSILAVIMISTLHNVPAFLGYKAIFHQLKSRPSFWTLVLLLFFALSRYIMLLVISFKSSISSLLLTGFALSPILTVILACVLNYTHLNFLKRRYPRYVFTISKLSLLVIFVVNFTNFVTSLLAVTLNVHDFHQALTAKNSTDFKVIHGFLGEFGVTGFRFKLMSFFWSKMFVDHKSIL
ncbi:uncharacterized protein LOC144654790 isoform X1 [Oculina patagonica]